MGRVHITLVGGQPAPVYHGIVATKPEMVVFIYSEESKEVVELLKREINIPIAEQPSLDPVDPVEISMRANHLAEIYKNDEVTVNISSGLKSWSHIFGVVFDKQPNATVVYMDQNNVLWNYRTMQSATGFAFDMHTLFRLYGNSLENNYRKLSTYTEEDIKVAFKLEEIRRFNYKSFNSLLARLKDEQKQTLKSSKQGRFNLNGLEDYVEWNRKSNEDDVDVYEVEIALSSRSKGFKKWKLVSPNAMDLAFNSGWFEFKVARLLSTWNKAKEICMNCHFQSMQNLDKNEVDIIVNTGTKILFVECKTQISKITDIDKFRSVVKAYGGTGSKGVFITDAKLTDIAKEKCEENGLLSFSLQGDNIGLTPEKALHFVLDSELFNINTM